MRASAARQHIAWTDVYFQQDGAAAHFARLVRDYLDMIFPNRWIGRMGPIAWPPRSPDLTRTIPDTLQEMEDRIMENCLIPDEEMFNRVRESFEKRIFMCMHEEGKQFEHLL